MRKLTLSEAAKITGAKPRTLQFWTLNDVIRCDPETKHSGPGVPRLYSQHEVAIAAVLSQLSRVSLPIGELARIADSIRLVYARETFSDPASLWEFETRTSVEAQRLQREYREKGYHNFEDDNIPEAIFDDYSRINVELDKNDQRSIGLENCKYFYFALFPQASRQELREHHRVWYQVLGENSVATKGLTIEAFVERGLNKYSEKFLMHISSHGDEWKVLCGDKWSVKELADIDMTHTMSISFLINISDVFQGIE